MYIVKNTERARFDKASCYVETFIGNTLFFTLNKDNALTFPTIEDAMVAVNSDTYNAIYKIIEV